MSRPLPPPAPPDFSPSPHSRSPSPPSPTYPTSNPPPYISPIFYPRGTFSLSSISLTSLFLGLTISTCLHLTFTLRHSYPQLPLFLASLATFHFLEYWVTAHYNTSRAKSAAFILFSNGAQYHAAHTAALLEACIEYWAFPGLKTVGWWTYLGLGLVVCGQVLRTVAMAQAGGNFSHYVATRKEREHRLVREGVYGVLRHPSYCGYWWWAVGTQVMLGNPVCTVGFGLVLWGFFKSRIRGEERLLSQFFPDYQEYRKVSWVGIPGLG